MQLIVNGENIDITLENEKTVGDVLKSFESEAAKNDSTTTSIRLNGKDIEASDFDAIVNEPLSDSTVIELTVLSKFAVQDSLHECADNFNALKDQLQNISVLLQTGKDEDANKIIKDLAEELDIFCSVARLSTLFPELYEKISVEGKNIDSFFADFAPILKDFEDALQNKDTVTVGDLAEYEILPRLEQLSTAISVIPC